MQLVYILGMVGWMPSSLRASLWLDAACEAKRFGPHALNIRFDPIVHYRRVPELGIHDNLQDFEQIVCHIGGLGIRHITFSFCKAYKQSVRNMLSANVELVALSEAQQRQVSWESRVGSWLFDLSPR